MTDQRRQTNDNTVKVAQDVEGEGIRRYQQTELLYTSIDSDSDWRVTLTPNENQREDNRRTTTA